MTAARRFYDDADALYILVQDLTGRLNVLISNARLARRQNERQAAIRYYTQLFELTDHHPAFKDHPITRSLHREYEQFLNEDSSQNQNDHAAEAMRALAQLYSQGGAGGVRAALAGKLPDAAIDLLLQQLAGMPIQDANPPATLPKEMVEGMARNTIAVKTGVPDKLDEWRQNLTQLRADFAGEGDDYATEVAFADALLTLLDDGAPSLPPDNPYADVIAEVARAIAAYREGGG